MHQLAHIGKQLVFTSESMGTCYCLEGNPIHTKFLGGLNMSDAEQCFLGRYEQMSVHPDRAPVTDQENHSNQVHLGRPLSLLDLLTRV